MQNLVAKMIYLFIKQFGLEVLAMTFYLGNKNRGIIIYRNCNNIDFVLVGIVAFCSIPPRANILVFAYFLQLLTEPHFKCKTGIGWIVGSYDAGKRIIKPHLQKALITGNVSEP